MTAKEQAAIITFQTLAKLAQDAAAALSVPDVVVPPPPPATVHGVKVAQGPTAWVPSAYVVSTRQILNVPQGASLQGALDRASPGDVITLAAGATFTGPFTLRKKPAGPPIVIRSDAVYPSSFAEGTRLTPANAGHLPKLIASAQDAAVLWTEPGASNYRLLFTEVAPAPGQDLNTLVRLGSGASDQTTLADCPSNIVIDRCYLHGLASNSLVRAVQMHGANIAVVDSYLSEIHANGQDSQAIVSYNGPGPYKIVNNFLSAAGENVMFGGADPLIPGMIASDIVMQRNYVWKDLAWKGSVWNVKNHLEFKVGQRALIEGNIFENCWVAAQSGLSILIKSTNQSGGFTGAVSRDIVFRNNIVRNVTSGIVIAARPDGPAIAANLITVSNNLFIGLGDRSQVAQRYAGMRFSGDLSDILLQHNTVLFAPGLGNITLQFDGLPRPTRVAVINSVLQRAKNYGVLAFDGGGGEGAASLASCNAVFEGNVMDGVSSAKYPTGNAYPTTLADVGPDFKLLAASKYRGTATDGTDPGADVDAVNAATAGVVIP